MARHYNKLTQPDQFRLNLAVQQHMQTSGHATFTAYADAAAFFAKKLGLEISAKNIENAAKTVGVQGLIVRSKGGDTLTPMWRSLRDSEARIKLLESRVAEIESLFKS